MYFGPPNSKLWMIEQLAFCVSTIRGNLKSGSAKNLISNNLQHSPRLFRLENYYQNWKSKTLTASKQLKLGLARVRVCIHWPSAPAEKKQ